MRLRKLTVFLFITFSCTSFAQLKVNFQKDSISEIWQGDDTCFVISPEKRLQLKAPKSMNESYLSIYSKAISDAEWELSLQMNFNPSSSNFMRFYLCSDSPNLSGELNGYYLQIGGTTSDQILFYRQTGKSKKLIGEGDSSRLDMDTVRIIVKINRDNLGNWNFFSKKADETDFIQEFTCKDSVWNSSFYAGLYCKFSATRNENFFFDSLLIQGEAYTDTISPFLKSYEMQDSILKLTFSERIDTGNFQFNFEPPLTYQKEWAQKQTELCVRFKTQLEQGIKYTLDLNFFQDMYKNISSERIILAHIDSISEKDIIINEVLFHPKEGGVDYVELYNRSNKTLDLSQLKIATRRSDSTLYSAKALNKEKRLIFPSEYVLLTTDTEGVCNFYNCPEQETFFILDKLPAYANSKGCVVLINGNNDVIDELYYTESMHHEFIKQKTGVSLERQSSEDNIWTSASEDIGYGTPGYKNSQSINQEESNVEETSVKLTNEVCFPYGNQDEYLSLNYQFKKGGYIANISIFSIDGRCLRNLAQKLSLSTEGDIYWDGRDQNGNILSVSPYIILFEAFHPDGDVYRQSFVGIISK